MATREKGNDPQLANSALPRWLHGQFLTDAFRSLILDGKSLCELGFDDVQFRIDYHWPVDRSLDGSSFPILKADGAGGFETFADSGPNPPLIQMRFRTLVDWLRDGQLVACWRDRNNQRKEVPRYLWSRPGVYIDFFRGDLVERKRGHSAAVLFQAIELKVPAMTDGEGDSASPPSNIASKGTPGRKTKYDWDGALRYMMQIANSPDGLPEPQAEIERLIAQWFVDRINKQPAESLIREKVAKWLPPNYRSNQSGR